MAIWVFVMCLAAGAARVSSGEEKALIPTEAVQISNNTELLKVTDATNFPYLLNSTESTREVAITNMTQSGKSANTIQPTEEVKTTQEVRTTMQVKTTTSPTTTPRPRGPVKLPNELCKLRPALINTDPSNYKYIPLVISLHRCDGACGILPPSIRVCTPIAKQVIPVYLFNRVHFRPELVNFANHTSCGCTCAQNSSICDQETQVFNKTLCKCVCKKGAKPHMCPPNHVWDPVACRCACDARCNRRQEFNSTSCSCICRRKFYKRCNKKKKIIDEETCRCRSPPGWGKATGEFGCATLPRKWVALIAIIASIAILILAFDIVLLGKQTGFCHSVVTWLSKVCGRSTHMPIQASNT